MKCHRPGTDQSLELSVFANGMVCEEYELQASSITDPSVVSCFIPVEEGDELTIRGTFTGSCLHGSLDTLADGSFLADRRIEAPKDGDIRHYTNRKVDFRSVFDAPKVKGHISVFAPDKVVEGNLHVKALGERSETAASFPSPNVFGIGTLVVLVTLNQRTDDNHTNKYKSLTCGDPDIGRKGDDHGGIPPSYELVVRALEGDVSRARQSKHKRHSEQTRFGPKPWAKLIFYYRSKKAIEDAGCVERNGESHALEPGDAETFIRSSIEGARPKVKKGSPEAASVERNDIFNTPPPGQSVQLIPAPIEQVKAITHAQATEDEEAEFYRGLSTPKAELLRGRSQPGTTPSAPSKPPAKGKLMGQSLNLPLDFVASPLGRHGAKEQPDGDSFKAAMEEYQREQEAQQQEEDQRLQKQGPSFAEFNLSAEKLPMTGFPQMMNDGTSPTLRDVGSGEPTETIEDAQSFLDTSQDGHFAPVAQMVAPADADPGDGSEGQTVNEMIVEERTVEVEEEEQTSPAPSRVEQEHADTSLASPPSEQQGATPTNTRIASASRSASPAATTHAESARIMETSQPSKTADEPVSCTLTADGVLRQIPANGIALEDLQMYFDEEQLPHGREAAEQFLTLVKQVGKQKKGKYYPRTHRGSQGGSPSPSQSREESFLVHRDSKVSPAKSVPVVSPLKSASVEHQEEFKPPKVERADTPAVVEASPAPTSTTAVSKKRSASAFAASRESTPASKKPRFDAFAVRKAELKLQLEEMQKRKAAAQKAVEEQQNLREREEQLREEAEEREVAMLVKMVAEENEETGILEGMAEAEEELLREAKAGRQREEEALRASEEA